MAAAPPPDDPNVEVTIFVTDAEFDALERLAQDRHTSPELALREALESAVFIQDLLSQGFTIFYRRPDGTERQILFD
jgi:hypothetical protein